MEIVIPSLYFKIIKVICNFMAHEIFHTFGSMKILCCVITKGFSIKLAFTQYYVANVLNSLKIKMKIDLNDFSCYNVIVVE